MWRIRFTICLLMIVSCNNHQHQHSIEELEGTVFFKDKRGARTPPPETYSLTQLEERKFDPENGNYPSFLKVDRPFVEKGQILFSKMCIDCHGYLGEGDGIAFYKGLNRPADLNNDDIQKRDNAYYYSVIKEGKRKMPSFASRLGPKERWQVIAYLRALQLSQTFSYKRLTKEEKEHFK